MEIRERLLEAASQITTERGWSAVTMGKVAGRVGVSRQTVYNVLGSKSALGQAMVLRELERFLAVVAAELDGHDDVVDAIRSAAEQVLLMARGNLLLEAVLASAHGVSRGLEQGSNNELLPFLTTDAEPLIEAAKTVIAERVPARFPGLAMSEREVDVAIDAVVRLLLSHVMAPGDEPEATAADVAWIVERMLRRR
jgi:AcrR family transcriptional regulator